MDPSMDSSMDSRGRERKQTHQDFSN